MTRFITIGIWYAADVPDFRILSIDAETPDDAKDIAEAVGNVPSTTVAWTSAEFGELALDCSAGHADYMQVSSDMALGINGQPNSFTASPRDDRS